MSTILLELDDYIITNIGEIITKPKLLLSRLRNLERNLDLQVFTDDLYEQYDIQLYNNRNPDHKLVMWEPNEDILRVETYRYNIPKEYLDIDVEEYVLILLRDKFAENIPEIYINRYIMEFDMMKSRNMYDFLRSLIYLVDIFKNNDIVHGIGRGSSCASLILYLIGVHFVDPVEYDIPIDEFLR